MDSKKFKETALGGILNNPVFVLVLGMCPTIAKSTNINDAFALGVATAAVLVFSNVVISALRKVIPSKVRLPAYLMIVSSFVIVIQMLISSYMPSLNESIGPFIALIAVNCVILARIESFASKNSVGYSLLDGVSMGLGFVAAICLLGAIRQLLVYLGLGIFGKTAGGFIVLGLLMALFNYLLAIYNAQKTKKLIKEVE